MMSFESWIEKRYSGWEPELVWGLLHKLPEYVWELRSRYHREQLSEAVRLRKEVSK